MEKNKPKIYQVGVMASESIEASPELRARARLIGQEIAKQGHVLITGGGVKGVPLSVAEGARSAGGSIVAIAPGFSPINFRSKNESSENLFNVVIQTGLSSSPVEKNSIGLDYLNVNSCDALIFIGGKIGTFAEFLIALKADKIIVINLIFP